jgi:hypothetical protein
MWFWGAIGPNSRRSLRFDATSPRCAPRGSPAWTFRGLSATRYPRQWWASKRHARHARTTRRRRLSNRIHHLTPEAPSSRRAPRGCPLRLCWDPRKRSTPVTVIPTLSKTAPRRRREEARPHGALSSVCQSRRPSDLQGGLYPSERSGGRRAPAPAHPVPFLCLCGCLWMVGGSRISDLASGRVEGSVRSVGNVLLSAFICVISGLISSCLGARVVCCSSVIRARGCNRERRRGKRGLKRYNARRQARCRRPARLDGDDTPADHRRLPYGNPFP